MRPKLGLWLVLALLLCSCMPRIVVPSRHSVLNVFGPPPDVIILAMSGHCAPPCRAPRDNWDYLTTRGGLDTLADTFVQQGYTVQVSAYAANALASYASTQVEPWQRGYASLLSDFADIKRWLSSPKPPRIVLLGHSHGSVWLHHFVRTHPEVQVALQVDLDSSCTAWELDFVQNIQLAQIDQPGQPKATGTCQANIFVGNRRYRPKDIVYPNVLYNLEVHSKRLPNRTSEARGLYFNYLFETVDNIRLDGSRKNIQTYVSVREDHSAISYVNSDAMRWVKAKTAEIIQTWRTEDMRITP